MGRSLRRKVAIACIGAVAALGVSAGPFIGAASASNEDALHSCFSTTGGIFNAWIKSALGNGKADSSNGISQFGWVCLYI